MKTLSHFALLLLLAPGLWAALEPIGIIVTQEPPMPARLRMDGVLNGRVMVAIDVDAEGKLVEWLVVGASHRELIRPCVEALQNWRFRPARYDGLPVMAQLKLTIEVSQTGAVVSRTAMENAADWIERVSGRRNDYQVCPVAEVDRPPVAITTVAPRYAEVAEKQGVRGRITVHFYIDEQGTVRMPAVPADTPPYLSYVAIKALREWKFQPPTSRGRPVLVAAAQEFDFGEGR